MEWNDEAESGDSFSEKSRELSTDSPTITDDVTQRFLCESINKL